MFKILKSLCVISVLFGAESALSKSEVGESKMPNQTFTVSTKVPVGRSTAFRFFLEKEFLERWLTTTANVEAKLGGKYELFWDPNTPDDNSTKGCRITAIEPDRAFEELRQLALIQE